MTKAAPGLLRAAAHEKIRHFIGKNRQPMRICRSYPPAHRVTRQGLSSASLSSEAPARYSSWGCRRGPRTSVGVGVTIVATLGWSDGWFFRPTVPGAHEATQRGDEADEGRLVEARDMVSGPLRSRAVTANHGAGSRPSQLIPGVRRTIQGGEATGPRSRTTIPADGRLR